MKIDFRTVRADEIDIRISQIDKSWCTLLLFKDARVDQNILDETVGQLNWQRHHSRENANCIVSIWDEDKKQWVEKEDTGVESFSQAEKGLASDSFKRACFNWGIGRELYTAPSIFVLPRKDMGKLRKPEEEPNEFFLGTNGKYTTKTKFYVDYIDYDENRNIKDLIIRDHKGNMRFSQLTEEAEKERNKKIEIFKKLIEKNEDKDDNFERKELYNYFKVDNDAQLNEKQLSTAITLLEKRLKK